MLSILPTTDKSPLTKLDIGVIVISYGRKLELFT